MNDNKAIVRELGKNYKKCITSHPLGHTVNLMLAKEQHAKYCQLLTELGLELIKLPAKDDYPDSCFVEDNAVVYKKKAFITRMGAESRRGEEDDVGEILREYFKVGKATAPATIEGGDVVHLPQRLLCGITQRTNLMGVTQMKEWFNVRVDTITNTSIVHLKSYMKYLGHNKIITTNEYEKHPLLEELELIIIPKEESYSVNCLAINDNVIMSNKFLYAQEKVKNAGFIVYSLNMSEFEKCQASLTCLSIIF